MKRKLVCVLVLWQALLLLVSTEETVSAESDQVKE